MSDETPTAETLEQARREIQGLLREISLLSKQDIEVEEYFQKFLSAVVSALAAAGGAVWKPGEGGELELVTQMNMRVTELDEEGSDEARHQRLLAGAMAKGESMVMPPYSGNDSAGNPTRFLLLLVPLRSDDAIEGMIEIFQRPGASMDVQRGYVKFLHGACDKAGEWMRARKYRQLRHEQDRWRSLDELCQAVHESLNSREAAFAIANEARAFIGCDRVSVATRHGSTFRLQSISGQDTVDKRSNLFVLMQKLVRRVLAAGDPFWYDGSTEDLPPQLEESLQAYVDFAHTKTLGIVPLRRLPEEQQPDESAVPEAEIVGALVVEQIEDNRKLDTVRQRALEVTPHASRAITNAYDHESMFLMPLWRAIGKSRVLVSARNLPKTLLAIAAALIAIVVCLVVPIRFDLEGAAELQPVERRNVFASMQGVVDEVYVDTGDDVQPGDPLLKLRNTELKVQIEDLQGRLAVASEQLMEYERQLLGSGGSTPQERARWASELSSLRKQVANYDTQLDLLAEREKELTITSPIAGEIITWDARRLLRNRPVSPGQVLLTVADSDSEWELLIRMPEDNIGYITERQQALNKQDLEVTYILATSPGKKHEGTMRDMHLLAEPHESAGHTVKIAVDIDEKDLDHPRPGATATAQVHCGYRSIAFVWLHDVVEFIQTKVFF